MQLSLQYSGSLPPFEESTAKKVINGHPQYCSPMAVNKQIVHL